MTAITARPRLQRPRDSVLSGVSAGLARHLGWPVAAVRGRFVVLTLFAGAGALLYAWLWALTPIEDPTGDDDPVTRVVPVAVLLVALQTPGRVHRGLGAPGRRRSCRCRSGPWSARSPRSARSPGRSPPTAAIRAGAHPLPSSGSWPPHPDRRGDPAADRPVAARCRVVAVFLRRGRRAILFIPRVVALWNELVGRTDRADARRSSAPRSPRTCTTPCCRRSRSSRTGRAPSRGRPDRPGTGA